MQAQPALHGPAANPIARVAKPAAIFIARFLEMCVAMCAGGFILSFVFFGAAGLLGAPDFFERYTPIAILVFGIDSAIAMAAWMAFRHHPWRHNIEMSSTSIIAAAGFLVAYWFGIVEVKTAAGWFNQFAVQCGPACLLMLVYMLFRFDHYTGRSARHTGMA